MTWEGSWNFQIDRAIFNLKKVRKWTVFDDLGGLTFEVSREVDFWLLAWGESLKFERVTFDSGRDLKSVVSIQKSSTAGQRDFAEKAKK